MVDSQRTTDRLTHARAAVFAIFGLNGFLLALWVVHIPAIRNGWASITRHSDRCCCCSPSGRSAGCT
ncbi:hypothetical protein M1C57_20990 [Rhodococcus pyridinivorans]|uniref:hypothetical protein n=1 Tax=Rhodococcus pyridinivorans TaxID=103816 RepID=UPI00200A6D5A|nr:hypothetical protein [Rhodococcus pyridinivorans]UPW04067.1 hypothetical protein M1C57_20990 [Rhodococcus pyridinivorans]